MDKITQTMMNLIGSEVCGGEINPALYASLAEEERVVLYRLSRKHDLAHLVGNALINNGLIEEGKLKETYRQEVYTAVYRYEQISYELGEIKRIFSEEKIPFIPLKGAVIRGYYPEPWHRTSCDIDILIHEKNLERAVKALKVKAQYVVNKQIIFHDVSLFAPSGVHLELHFTLLEKKDLYKVADFLSGIWEFDEIRTDGCEKKLSFETFYFYHIAHMVKHFIHGGCGIKPFLDLWVLNHSEKVKFDKERRNAMLSEGELSKFADEAEHLSEVWFGQAKHTETTQKMETYVLQGGVYGTMQNRMVVQEAKKGGKIRYVFSRIWLPYDTIKFHFPVLKNHKWLLPLCQVRRWFKLLFKGRLKHGINEFSLNRHISKEEQQKAQEMLDELGLI